MNVLRNELKFYITYKEYVILKTILGSVLEKDKNSKNGPYLVKSLYFDTINNNAFYEKAFGLEFRKKFRLRVYNSTTNKIKFEIKHKANNRTFKETAFISKEDTNQILNKNYEVLLNQNNTILNKIYLEFKKKNMCPVVLVSYFRDAYVSIFNKIRITFDMNLESSEINKDLFSKNKIFKYNGKPIILEVKFDGFLPNSIKNILSSVPNLRSAISKYCLSRQGELI